MKVEILLTYFNRPILLKNALSSILKSHVFHPDWRLIFGDDNSPVPGEPIVREVLGGFLDRITFINTKMSFLDKIANGLAHGKYANEVIRDSVSDIGVFLCDDDELVPTYLHDLSHFFTKNPQIMYCYSKIHLYNPLFCSSVGVNNVVGHYNKYEEPINPANKLDVSQVAFRIDCCRKYNVQFPVSTIKDKPWSVNIDAGFFQGLFDAFGPAVYSGLVAQYKGIHDYQMVWHKKKDSEGLEKYMQEIIELGGKKF